MLIGEAPGSKEELLKVPFIGRSGKVIQKLFESIGIDFEEDIYICNVMKCRPPNNRRPTNLEIEESLVKRGCPASDSKKNLTLLWRQLFPCFVSCKWGSLVL